jgi:hypothetical protein
VSNGRRSIRGFALPTVRPPWARPEHILDPSSPNCSKLAFPQFRAGLWLYKSSFATCQSNLMRSPMNCVELRGVASEVRRTLLCQLLVFLKILTSIIDALSYTLIITCVFRTLQCFRWYSVVGIKSRRGGDTVDCP